MDCDDSINNIQDGESQKGHPIPDFFPVTSTNAVISPQKFLTFSFKPFCNTGAKFQRHT